MANPDPNRATRFRPGQSGNPSGKPGKPFGPERMTILKRTPVLRSWEELEKDPNVWKGRARDLFRLVMADPEIPLELRLHCAAVLEKREPDGADKPKRPFDLKHLTNRERSAFLHIFNKATGQPPPAERDPELVACLEWLAEADDDASPPLRKPPRQPRQAAVKPAPREPALLPPPKPEAPPAPAQRGGIAGAILIGRPDRGTRCGQCNGSLFDADAATAEPRRWCCPRCAPLPAGVATLTVDTEGSKVSR